LLQYETFEANGVMLTSRSPGDWLQFKPYAHDSTSHRNESTSCLISQASAEIFRGGGNVEILLILL